MKVLHNKISTDCVKGPETKDRVDGNNRGRGNYDFDVHSCDSGGKYQELPSLGGFTQVVEGSRIKRLHERDYNKKVLEKKEDLIDSIIKPDTNGPPFENISVPKRTL